MATTVELEKRLHIATQTREMLEQKTKVVQQGKPVPGSTQEALLKIQDVNQTLNTILEGEAFQRISKVLELFKSNLLTKQELTILNDNLDIINTVFTEVVDTLKGIDKNTLDVLVKLLTDEVAQQRSQRQLEKQFVDDLQSFLDGLR